MAGTVTPANAQRQFSGWAASFNSIRLDERFSLHAEAQFRSAGQLEHLQHILLRGGLNVHFGNKTATAGYGWIGTRLASDGFRQFVPEHRIWEQFIMKAQYGHIPVQHRFRLEQRFLGQPETGPEGIEVNDFGYANRIRYFARAVIPLQKAGSFQEGIFAALQNEVFLNFGNKRYVNGKTFDQNRAYAAFGYRFNPKFDLETGYLYQHAAGRDRNLNNHIWQVAFYTRL